MKKNWLNEQSLAAAFHNGDEVRFDVISPEYLNIRVSEYFDGTNTYTQVRPSKITFKLDGYSISADTGCSISAWGTSASELPVYVSQTGANPEIEATITAPIKDFGGVSTTKLKVLSSTETDATGKLILSGANTYKGGTEVTGGILQAVKPNSLPLATSGNYCNVAVTSTTENDGTLIVEARKDASGTTDLDWSSNDISKLLNASPTITTTFGAGTNFGISVDSGTSFEYSGVIPGNTTNLLENFLKLDTGTLTLSGTNTYPGDTTIKQGSLVAITPEALSHYDTTNEIFVKDAHVVGEKYNFDMGYGYVFDPATSTHHYNGTEDPHSTLIVQGLGVSSNGSSNGHGWTDVQIDSLASPNNGVFADNTNFGIQVVEGVEFNYGGHPFQAGKVGFVKTGLGILEFGSNDHTFSGPATINEGTLKAFIIGNSETNTFASNGSNHITSLFMTHDAVLDLNDTDISGYGYANTYISKLYGEAGTVITDNSPNLFEGTTALPRFQLAGSGNSHFSGKIVQGKYGSYPSLHCDNANLTLDGAKVDFFAVDLLYSDLVVNDACDVSVKSRINASGGSVTWNSSGTFTINMYNSVGEGVFSTVNQNKGTILITPSGEPNAVTSKAAFLGKTFVSVKGSTEIPVLKVVNSTLILSSSLNQEGVGTMSVSYGKMLVSNSTVLIGTAYQDGGTIYNPMGYLSVDHGAVILDDKSSIQIFSSIVDGKQVDFYAQNTLTIGVDGIVETHKPIEFICYNYFNLQTGSSTSYYNASVIFDGGILKIDDDFPASAPVFAVAPPDHTIPETIPYSYKTPHIYISEYGANIVTNNLNAKNDLPLEHDPALLLEGKNDGGLRINSDTAIAGETFTGCVTLSLDNHEHHIYTEIDDPNNHETIYFQRYWGDTTVYHGSLFLGDGTAKHDAPLRWIDPDTDDEVYPNFVLEYASSSLVFYNHDEQVYDGIISGPGTVTKSGVGQLTLEGANSYTGGTILQASGNGSLALGNTYAIGATSGYLSVNSGTLDLRGNSISVSALTGKGGTIKSSQSPANLLETTGIYYGTVESTVTLSNGVTQTASFNPIVLDVVIELDGVNEFSPRFYTVGGTISFLVMFDRAVTASGASPTLTFGSGLNGRTALWDSSSNNSTTLRFTYAIQDHDNTDNLDYALDGVLSGTIVSNSLPHLPANLTLPIPGTPYSLANSNISIDTHLYWTGDSGSWDANTTPWHIGSPRGEQSNWVPGADAVFWSLNGGTVYLSNNIQVNSISFEKGGMEINSTYDLICPTGGSTISINVDVENARISSQFSNLSDNLIKTGKGTLILTADNSSFAGVTTIQEGTLQLGDSDVSLIGGTLINYDRLLFDYGDSSDVSIDNRITGSGTLIKAGFGKITINHNNANGPNNYTGGTIIEEGTLAAGYDSNASSSPYGTGGVTIHYNGKMEIGSHNIIVSSLAGSGPIIGSSTAPDKTLTIDTPEYVSSKYSCDIGEYYLAITKTGLGTQILAGDNHYLGSTTINGGILQFAKPESLPNDNFTVGNGGTLAVNVGGSQFGEWTEEEVQALLNPTK